MARALQAEGRGLDRPDALEVLVFTDSMGVALAGDLVNPFQGDSGESVFRAGRAYTLSVAVSDSNYYDFVRSRSDPITGRGFINHLRGGIGVFGSVEVRSYVLRLVDEIDEPPEGRDRLQGRHGALQTDVELELYLDAQEVGLFSAFVRGEWFGREVRSSLDGRFKTEAGDDASFAAQLEVPGERRGFTDRLCAAWSSRTVGDPVRGVGGRVQCSGTGQLHGGPDGHADLRTQRAVASAVGRWVVRIGSRH